MAIIDTIKKTTSKIGSVVKKTYGPLSPLEINLDPNDFRYPLEVGDSKRFPHTVEFQSWIPAQVPISDIGVIQATQNAGTSAFNAVARAVVKVDNAVDKFAAGAGVPVSPDRLKTEAVQITPYEDPYKDSTANMRVNRNQSHTNRTLDFTRRANRSDLITMYLPQGTWNDRISNQYAQQSMTAALGTLGAVVDVGGSIAKELADLHVSGTPGSAWDLVNGPAGMELAGKIAEGLGMNGEAVRDAGLTAIGYALNPQFEMLYSGTDLREFQFDFMMTPRNVKEANMIRTIVQKFKYHASPEYVTGGPGRYISPPSYFDITFKFGSADSAWLPKISTCVLKSVDIDYTGGLDQWGAHADGSPIQTRMVLVFSELEMIHKALRKEGY